MRSVVEKVTPEQVFLLELWFSLISSIPRMVHTQRHLNSALVIRANSQSLETLKQSNAFSDTREQWTQKYSHISGAIIPLCLKNQYQLQG
jgi:hypothetical protein